MELMNFRSASLTHVGRKRDGNEDNLLCSATAKGSLFAVADVMGGHPAGEVASAIAVMIFDRVRMSFYAGEDPTRSIHGAFHSVHSALIRDMVDHPLHSRMGTTLTTFIGRPDGVWIGQVGDSRCYGIRDGRGTQVTVDQSYSGHILANVLGNKQESFLGATVAPLGVQKGDIFVLCSDGFSDYASAEKTAELVSDVKEDAHLLRMQPDPVKFLGVLAQTLVDFALEAGGHDNITVIVVEAY
jgi:PPM family protein phosphatase